MFATLKRAFRKMDTSEVDAAIAHAGAAHQAVRVRARALRMDVGCGRPGEAIERITNAVRRNAGPVLRNLYSPPESTPADMQMMLGALEGAPHGTGSTMARGGTG